MIAWWRRRKTQSHPEEHDCSRLWSTLSAYADGEADPREQLRVERHLEQCPQCRRDLAYLRNASALLASIPEAEPPARILAGIQAGTARRQPAPRRAWMLAPAAAGALTALACAVLFGPQVQNPVLSPPQRDRMARMEPEAAPSPAPDTSGSGEQPRHERRLPAAAPIPAPALRQPHTAPRHIVRLDVAPRTQPRATAPRHAAPVIASRRRGAPAPILGPDRFEMPAERPVTAAPEPQPMASAIPEPAPEPAAAPSPAPVAEPRPLRIQLVASAPALNPAQVATLADLRRELRRESAVFRTGELRPALGDKQIQIDVIKGSF